MTTACSEMIRLSDETSLNLQCCWKPWCNLLDKWRRAGKEVSRCKDKMCSHRGDDPSAFKRSLKTDSIQQLEPQIRTVRATPQWSWSQMTFSRGTWWLQKAQRLSPCRREQTACDPGYLALCCSCIHTFIKAVHQTNVGVPADSCTDCRNS